MAYLRGTIEFRDDRGGASRLRRFVLLFSLLWSHFLGWHAGGQSTAVDLDGEVRKLAEPIVARGRAVGISIGILDGLGIPHYYGFGRVGAEPSPAPNYDTLFEIGSITKCFTGILLADMTLKREVGLQDPAIGYLEEGARLPKVGGRPITLAELATYSSGLPRMPSNFGRTPAEHAHYTARAMLEELARIAGRQTGPGEPRHYLYSNLGFGLLGHCLSNRAGRPIRELILERVVMPLGMQSTCFEPGAGQLARVAKTHDQQGNPVPPWRTGAIAPAGMLRSSARDMLTFVSANVGRIEGPLSEAIDLAQKPRFHTGVTEKQPRDREIGLAWFVDPQTGLIDHDGATAGSSAYIVLDRKSRTGVVVLVNQARAPVIALARQIVRLLGGPVKTEEHPRAPHDQNQNEEESTALPAEKGKP